MDIDQTSAIASRPLGRTNEPVPLVMWELAKPSADAKDVVVQAASAGANWGIIPAALEAATVTALRTIASPLRLIIGVDPAALMHRGSRPLEDRLSLLGRDRCDGVILQNVTRDELKAGRPFHRLYGLRDVGKLRLILLDADTVADAEWMIENTPAHAVALPYGVVDQTARYRVFTAAAELGTALLSRAPLKAVWRPDPPPTVEQDVAFRAREPGVTSLIETLPPTTVALRERIRLLAAAAPDPAPIYGWESFQAAVPAPAKPRRGHPADEA